ncbi:MAG: guanylate kinase [Candidatus Moraniibacteriota bacterium]
MRNIFIISGPSGAGEDSIIDGLVKLLPIERTITTVTRSPRTGESDGHPYYFVSLETFRQKIADGEMAEYAEQYNGNFYGVTTKELERISASGKIGVWKIDYQGVETAKRMFPGIIAIFITAPLNILEQRIRMRDNFTEKYIRERMEYTKEWLNHTDIYDYQIENEQGRLDEAIQKVAAIIKEHACRERSASEA